MHGVLGKFAKDVEGEGRCLRGRKNGLVFGGEHPLQPQRKGISRDYLVVFEIIQGPQGVMTSFFLQFFLFISQRQINIIVAVRKHAM